MPPCVGGSVASLGGPSFHGSLASRSLVLPWWMPRVPCGGPGRLESTVVSAPGFPNEGRSLGRERRYPSQGPVGVERTCWDCLVRNRRLSSVSAPILMSVSAQPSGSAKSAPLSLMPDPSFPLIMIGYEGLLMWCLRIATPLAPSFSKWPHTGSAIGCGANARTVSRCCAPQGHRPRL